MKIKFIIFFIFSNIFSYTAQEILEKLTLEQKIAQLIFVRVENSGNQTNFNKAINLVEKYQIGGACFIQHGTIESCSNRIQELQKSSQIPLIICQDFEWGLSMRLKDALNFPCAQTLGAIKDNTLIYEMAFEIGRQCKLLGIHINFAPVADLNTNINNPIIGFRSFSDDPNIVADKTIAFMNGLHDAGIIACAKHFPGHGDTEKDSHLELPIIKHSINRINTFELYPFKKLIDAGIKMVMSAHIHVPSIDNRQNRSITLSYNAITKLLKENLKFNGLTITDDLNMQAVAKHFKPGHLELEAFLAGNDILLMPSDVQKTIEIIKDAIEKKIINITDVNSRVLKILKLKEDLGLLSKNNYIAKIELSEFHTDKAKLLKQKLYESAITLVKDNQNILPISNSNNSIAHLQINGEENSEFNNYLKDKLSTMETYILPCPPKPSAKAGSGAVGEVEGQSIYKQLKSYDTIIISIFQKNKWRDLDFNISLKARELIDLLKDKKIILTIFHNASSLQLFKLHKTIIMAYEPDVDAQIAAAKVILGQLKSLGILPIKI